MQQSSPEVRERVDMSRGTALLLLGGLGHRAGFVKPAQRWIQRVVVQHHPHRRLDPFAELIAVSRAGEQMPQDQNVDE